MTWPTVIFDIDGTLVNSVDLIVASYQHAFRTVLGHEQDEAEIKTWIGQSIRDGLERTWPDQADDIFREYTQWNEAHTEEWISEYPGIPDLVKSLVNAGIKIGAATSKRTEPAQWALDLGHLNGLVPLLVAHDDVFAHKPDPEPLLLAATKLGSKPADCVYVGDAVVDILAAHNAGMASVAVTWGAGTRQAILDAQPDVLCDTVDELRQALLG